MDFMGEGHILINFVMYDLTKCNLMSHEACLLSSLLKNNIITTWSKLLTSWVQLTCWLLLFWGSALSVWREQKYCVLPRRKYYTQENTTQHIHNKMHQHLYTACSQCSEGLPTSDDTLRTTKPAQTDSLHAIRKATHLLLFSKPSVRKSKLNTAHAWMVSTIRLSRVSAVWQHHISEQLRMLP